MNTGQLKTALKRYGFTDSDPLLTWLNAALHEFAGRYNWPFLETVVESALAVGDDTIILPADFGKVISLKIKGFTKTPQYKDLHVFEDMVEDDTVTGVPDIYTLIGLSTIVLYPVNDAPQTVRLIYRKKVSDLVNDVDVPGVDVVTHYAIVLKAAAIGLQAEDEEDRASTASDEFDSAVISAIAQFSTKQEHAPAQVIDSAGYCG